MPVVNHRDLPYVNTFDDWLSEIIMRSVFMIVLSEMEFL